MNTWRHDRDSDRSQAGAPARLARRLGGISLAVLVLASAGCSMLRYSSSPPKAQVASTQLTGKKTGPVSFQVLQAQVMRFADTYAATVAQSCDDVTANTTNPAIRLAALRWKLEQATSIFTDASGQNPAVNALDMLVLVTMARMVAEDYGVEIFGEAAEPVVAMQRAQETNAWLVAEGMLKPSQEKELRNLIQQWRLKNPHQRFVGPIRFSEFVTALGRIPTQSTTTPTSIFSLLYLDPLAGLDPTSAAIQETRELGERAMYYSQRMPMLLSWQAEVLVCQLAEQPESKQILNDANRLATATEIFAQTARQLPQLVNDQRQAAIQQVLDGLTAESDKTRGLLTDTRSTLNSASEAAAAINTAIQSLTEFVRYVSPTNASPAAAATNSQPFNVLDYGTAASQIGTAARDLNATLQTINQSTPELADASRQAAERAKRVVDHAFWCGVILILIFVFSACLAGLSYRLLANKIQHPKSAQSPPASS